MTASFTSQWISPFQAMPPIDNSTSVLVLVYDEATGIDLAYFDYAKHCWQSTRSNHLANVIAWCPLPPTPVIADGKGSAPVPAQPNHVP